MAQRDWLNKRGMDNMFFPIKIRTFKIQINKSLMALNFFVKGSCISFMVESESLCISLAIYAPKTKKNWEGPLKRIKTYR